MQIKLLSTLFIKINIKFKKNYYLLALFLLVYFLQNIGLEFSDINFVFNKLFLGLTKK